MPSVFKSYVTNNIGISGNIIFIGPLNTQTTVIGLSIANKFTQPIDVDFAINKGNLGANTFIVKNATVPKGGALVPVGGAQKIVIEQNDILYVFSSVTSSADVLISTLEIT
jgi:hypothetical protein